ncbi:MAG: V-type ATPase subunit [Candidatus Aminicenantaceae bacterium]
MKKENPLDYAYAVGRVRALERNLIPRSIFLGACDDENFFSALKEVFDAGAFIQELKEIRDSRELDQFIRNEEDALIKDVSILFLNSAFTSVIGFLKAPWKALESARPAGNRFIIDYFRHLIDLGNLKLLARTKYLTWEEEQLRPLLAAGGFLDTGRILSGLSMSFADFSDSIQATSYGEIWADGVDALENEETFIDLERGMEDFRMRFLRRAKHITFGPEPVFAYALARKQELGLLRILGVGKLNRVPPEILKRRMSETYV